MTSRPIERPSSWREAQLLVVAAQHLDVEDLALGQELARGGRRLDLLADERLGRRGRDRHLLQQRVLRRALLEGQAGRAEHDLVAVAEHVLADPLAAQERAVEAAEIAEQEVTVGLPDDLGVLLGHDAVQDLQRVVGMTTDRVDRPELVLAALVVAGDDDLGHAEGSPVGDAQERHHTLAGAGIPK